MLSVPDTVSNSHQIPKDTTLHQQRCANLHSPSPLFTVLSVPDTRTAFTYCCSFNWKRKTNENFVLNIINLVLVGGEFLGSGQRRFYPGEEKHFIQTRSLCGSQNQPGRFRGHRKHSPLPEFETWDRRPKGPVCKSTAPVLFKNLSSGILVA